MHWIFLSPHFDDAVYSCGGLIYEQVQRGDKVEIWTICAGDLPAGDLSLFAEELHARWMTGRETITARATEDLLASSIVGASLRRFSLQDCIYRFDLAGRPLISKNEDLFKSLDESQISLAEELAFELRSALPKSITLVSPLAIGGHIDHKLVRLAAEKIGCSLWYYADFPYVLRQPPDLEGMGIAMKQVISPTGLLAWQNGLAAYASQITSFWKDEAEMRSVLTRFCADGGGSVLWQRVDEFDSTSGGLHIDSRHR